MIHVTGNSLTKTGIISTFKHATRQNGRNLTERLIAEMLRTLNKPALLSIGLVPYFQYLKRKTN